MAPVRSQLFVASAERWWDGDTATWTSRWRRAIFRCMWASTKCWCFWGWERLS